MFIGQIEYMDDPLGFEKRALKSLLKETRSDRMVCVSENDSLRKVFATDVHSGEMNELKSDHELYRAVKICLKVFKRIKASSLTELDVIIRNLEDEVGFDSLTFQAMNKGKHFLLDHNTDATGGLPVEELERRLGMVQEELSHFLVKRKAMRDTWTLVITDDEAPNAFVNGFLPKRLFVT